MVVVLRLEMVPARCGFGMLSSGDGWASKLLSIDMDICETVDEAVVMVVVVEVVVVSHLRKKSSLPKPPPFL